MILAAKDPVGMDSKCLEILNQARAAQVPPLPAINSQYIASVEALGSGTGSLVCVTLDPPSFTSAAITPNLATKSSTLSVLLRENPTTNLPSQ
jgi:hypothetical protein